MYICIYVTTCYSTSHVMSNFIIIVNQNSMYYVIRNIKSYLILSYLIIHLLSHCAESSNKSNPEVTLAIFCDLSKAFDVISHDILLKKNTYGIRGIANQWFKSYLTQRSQFVEIDKNKSNPLPIQCDVPQGSILGPLNCLAIKYL